MCSIVPGRNDTYHKAPLIIFKEVGTFFVVLFLSPKVLCPELVPWWQRNKLEGAMAISYSHCTISRSRYHNAWNRLSKSSIFIMLACLLFDLVALCRK